MEVLMTVPNQQDVERIRSIVKALVDRDSHLLSELIDYILGSPDQLWEYLDQYSGELNYPEDDILRRSRIYAAEAPDGFAIDIKIPDKYNANGYVVLSLDFDTRVTPHKVVFKGVILS
jgi:hypothetical protein